MSKKSETKQLLAALRRNQGFLTTVESCTGGLVASRLTDIAGASDVFWGSAITYRDSAKATLAGVRAKRIASEGAVSAPVAIAMARGGLMNLRRAESAGRLWISIAITGLAGPKGNQRGLPVGSGFIGVAMARGRGGPVITRAISVPAPSRKLSRAAHKRRFARLAIRQALAALVLLASACSSGPGRYQHILHRVALDSLQLRRPPGESAEDSVYPDEQGYRSTSPPSARLGCQNLSEFFAGVDLPKVAACLKGVTAETTVSYRLERDVQPKLVLDEPKKAPACMKDLLPEILVPREIVFQNNEEAENPLSCFVSRLDLSEDKLFGVQIPFRHTYLQIELPLASTDSVSTPERTVNFLASWVLTPFLSNEAHEFTAKVVPNVICHACFGNMPLLKPEDRPVYWSSPDGNP